MSLDTTFSLQALFSVVASSQLAYLYPHKVKQIIPASCSSGTFIVEPVTPRSYHTEMAGHQDRKRNVLFYHNFFPHVFLHCLTVTLFLVLCFSSLFFCLTQVLSLLFVAVPIRCSNQRPGASNHRERWMLKGISSTDYAGCSSVSQVMSFSIMCSTSPFVIFVPLSHHLFFLDRFL